MISLTNVAKDIGKGRMRKRVLAGIDWTIMPLSQIVILGQPGAGKSTLLKVLSGMDEPTSGTVTQDGSICGPRGLAGLGTGLTGRQLARRAGSFYHCDPEEVAHFVTHVTQLGRLLDVPMRRLVTPLRQRIQYALRYAIPFDSYFFDGSIGVGTPQTQDLFRQAFELRRRKAAMIVATRSVSMARDIGGTCGILYNGRLTMFATVEAAISVFQTLPKVQDKHDFRHLREEPRDEDDGADDGFGFM